MSVIVTAIILLAYFGDGVFIVDIRHVGRAYSDGAAG
jgi:hypothetical protein